MAGVDLFEHHRARLEEEEAPLAARMRPRTLDEFVGQGAIVGPGRLLRRAIQADQLSSLLFHGPPGTGKTTLARIIANTTAAEFIAINAVLSGVKEIRGAIASAREVRGQFGRRTILFVDEVHRFNKAQQDALLPWVENGTVVLVGATTENPYFEVNKALVSRSRVFQLQPLEPADLRQVVEAAVGDTERGYGDRNVQVDEAALDHLVDVSNGDARALLNALELAVETTEPDPEGEIRISLGVAEESIQRRAVLYDKEGDTHFDAISAFIKSCRGSDADAALYWLARMVYAGEDPRYLLRRMLILASEDVGLADPDVLVRVVACAETFDRVGLPEGRFHLAQAALLLANAPKSNSTMGFFDALAAVERERDGEVPDHLKDPSRDKEGFGHGVGYQYPHAFKDHWVAQQYLPAGLQGQVFYQPSDQGHEADIREEVARRREAQLAASVVDLFDVGAPIGPGGRSQGPKMPATERWLRRATARQGQRLGRLRDRVFELSGVQRHHLVLDLGTRTGLLAWEAVRWAPEGGVQARVPDPAARRTLAEQVAALSELARPTLVERPDPELVFDRVVGRDALQGDFAALGLVRLAVEGRMVLAETVPRRTQRLYELVPPEGLDSSLLGRWAEAEEAVYAGDDPRFGWDAPDLQRALETAGFEAEVRVEPSELRVEVTPGLFDRWWDGAGDRSYAARLAGGLQEEEVVAVRAWSRRAWVGRSVVWRSPVAWAVARNSSSPG